MTPDLSDEGKMLHIGRMTVLRRARLKAARALRDRIVPMLNAIEGDGTVWNMTGVVELVDEINEINRVIAELN